MTVAHVGTYLQPFVDLIVSLQTTGETAVVGSCGDTIVAQVVGRTIECTSVRSTCGCNSILLTKAVVVDFIHPVVWSQVISCTIHGRVGTKGSVRIELAVGTNELLPLRKGINIITQAKRGVGNHVVIGPFPCLVVCIIPSTFCIVVKSLVPHLVVSSRALDSLVLRSSLRVRTPLSIYSKSTLLAFLGALGCNQDNTVTTTGTIKSCRRSILQHCHAFYVGRVDVVERATVW